MSTQYDVAILGGGFVGHTLLRVCQQLGLSACLVDAKPPVHTPTSDGRAIALSYTSVLFLQRLGVWNALNAHATAIERVHVSSQGHLGTLSCAALDLRIPFLGQVVPAPILGNALLESHETRVDTVTSVNAEATHATITLKESSFTASLVLACDGTHSFCRESLHFNTHAPSTHKKALVVNLAMDKSHQQNAYQRMIPKGVTALLPLPGNKVTAVVSLDAAEAEALHALTDEALSHRFMETWGRRFGSMQVTGPRFIYPLTQVYVKHPVQERVILIGNAAHTLNPIAAQGLNLALRDISMLRDVLDDAKAMSLDVGDYVPSVYVERIGPAHERMQRMTDAMVNLAYSTTFFPFQGMGLALLQHIPGVKTRWARAFAGLDGHRGQWMHDAYPLPRAGEG